MYNSFLNKIIQENKDRLKGFPNKGASKLPTDGWLDQYKNGGSSWMLTNPNHTSTFFPRMNYGGDPSIPNLQSRVSMFEDGGDSDVTTTTTMPPYSRESYSGADYLKKEKEHIQEANEFLKNWYTGRATLPEFTDVANARLKTLDTPLDARFVNPVSLFVKGADARYIPEGDYIEYMDPTKIKPKSYKGLRALEEAIGTPVLLHEIAHRLHLTNPQVPPVDPGFLPFDKSGLKQEDVYTYNWIKSKVPAFVTKEKFDRDIISQIFGNAKNRRLSKGRREATRVTSEPESVLMMLRHAENLDPTKKYTADDVSKMIQKYGSKDLKTPPISEEESVDKHRSYLINTLFKTMGNDPAKIADYMNRVAYQKAPQETTMAKMGGWLENYQDGGGLKNFISDWNTSPMGRSMLKASVNIDNPFGSNSSYVNNVINMRTNLAKNANVNISDDDQFYSHPEKSDEKILTYGAAVNKRSGLGIPNTLSGFLNQFTKNKMYAQSTRNPKDFGTNIYLRSKKIDSDQLLSPDTIDQNTIHELSHASDAAGIFIPQADKNKMYKYAHQDLSSAKQGAIKKLDEFDEYISYPTETRARLMNFRYNAKNQGLYDPFTEKVTLQKLKQYKPTGDLKESDPLMQLKNIYSDEQIVDLLNTVSKNDNLQKPLTVGKYGGWLTKYQGGGDIVIIDGKKYKKDSEEYKKLLDEGRVGTMVNGAFWGNKADLQPVTIFSSRDKDTNAFYKMLQQSDQYGSRYVPMLKTAMKYVGYDLPEVTMHNKAGTGFFDNKYSAPYENRYRPNYDAGRLNLPTLENIKSTVPYGPGVKTQDDVDVVANADLMENYFAELAHHMQRKNKGALDWKLRSLGEFIKHPIDSWKTGSGGDEPMYKLPGSIEYEAHTEIQPKLLTDWWQEFKKQSALEDKYNYPGTYGSIGSIFDKYKKGGLVNKYASGGEPCGPNQIYLEGEGCIDIGSKLYNELYEANKLGQRDKEGNVVQWLKPVTVIAKLSEEAKRRRLLKEMNESGFKNQSFVAPATEQSTGERIWDIATHPATAIRAYNQRGYVPNNLSAEAEYQGGTTAMLNSLSPASWIKGAYNAGKQLVTHPIQTPTDLVQGAGNLLAYGIHGIDSPLPGQTMPKFKSPFGDAGTNKRALEFLGNVGEALPLLEFVGPAKNFLKSFKEVPESKITSKVKFTDEDFAKASQEFESGNTIPKNERITADEYRAKLEKDKLDKEKAENLGRNVKDVLKNTPPSDVQGGKELIPSEFKNATGEDLKGAMEEMGYDSKNPNDVDKFKKDVIEGFGKKLESNKNKPGQGITDLLSKPYENKFGGNVILPKKYKGWLSKYANGGVIQDDNGYWNPDNRGKAVEIQGNKMATHGYGNIPLYVVPNKGNPRLVKANTGIQTFPGATKFTEYPVTNNWLDRYK